MLHQFLRLKDREDKFHINEGRMQFNNPKDNTRE